MNIVKRAEAYISKYSTLAEDYYLLPLALWAISTHCYRVFDAFPYLQITGYTKRCGKTRLLDLLCSPMLGGGICLGGQTFSADSPGSMLRVLDQAIAKAEAENREGGIVAAIDEAEKLNAEDHPAREFLNKGYRKGQTIQKTLGQVKEFQCYCPKAFALIGDLYDTLRDRCMIVVMRRRTPVEVSEETPFRFSNVKPEADELREAITNLVTDNIYQIQAVYAEGMRLDFLNDRDEEIWQPIFAMAQIFCPERIQELARNSVDMSTEKQAPKRKSFGREWAAAEENADFQEASILLLKDMLTISEGKTHLPSVHLIDDLKAIPTAQWRKFRGVGLTPDNLARLLRFFPNLRPGTIRISKSNGKGSTLKGYYRKDIERVAMEIGILSPE